MKKINIDVPIIVSRLKDCSTVKPILLKYLEEMPSNPMVPNANSSDKITKTDWNLPADHPRKYLDYVKPIIVETVSEAFSDFKLNGMLFENFWFQQYYKSDVHGWHVHMNCHWTNVYFIELPDARMKTEILKFGSGDLVEYDVNEGDILSFPSMLYHRSPPNLIDSRKTIISFNTNFISHFENLETRRI